MIIAFFREWDKESLKKNPSLIKALLRVHIKKCLLLTFLPLIKVYRWELLIVNLSCKKKIYFEEAILLIQPLIIRNLIRYFNDQLTFQSVLVYSSIFCINLVIYFFVHHPYHYYIIRQGMQVKISVCGLIYRKVRKSLYIEYIEEKFPLNIFINF